MIKLIRNAEIEAKSALKSAEMLTLCSSSKLAMSVKHEFVHDADTSALFFFEDFDIMFRQTVVIAYRSGLLFRGDERGDFKKS